MRRAICGVAAVVTAAAIWTGAKAGFSTCSMTGLLPPHYGYSAYFACALLFLGPRWVRWVAGAALLASGNRASWVGSLAGWAWSGGRRRVALAGVLAVLGTLGGLALKPYHGNDANRVMIWKTVVGVIHDNPQGVGDDFAMGVKGLEISHAHSDFLEIGLRWGVAPLCYALAAVILGLGFLLESPEKDLLVCLTFQSVIDNRVTTSWACAALYAAVWLAAALARPGCPGAEAPASSRRTA